MRGLELALSKVYKNSILMQSIEKLPHKAVTGSKETRSVMASGTMNSMRYYKGEFDMGAAAFDSTLYSS